MALTGTYLRTLDDKQRLALPKAFRENLCGAEGQPLFVAPETERSLALFSTEEFNTRARKLEEALPQRASVRNYKRLYYSQAECLEVDAQGRIRLPERLVTYAGLKQETVLLGVHDHVEIWDQQLWNEFLARHSAAFDQLASEALDSRP